MTKFHYAQLAYVGAQTALEQERKLLESAPERHIQAHKERIAKAEADVIFCLRMLKQTYNQTVK